MLFCTCHTYFMFINCFYQILRERTIGALATSSSLTALAHEVRLQVAKRQLADDGSIESVPLSAEQAMQLKKDAMDSMLTRKMDQKYVSCLK